jgi:very-short-patch-repair endonuclease
VTPSPGVVYHRQHLLPGQVVRDPWGYLVTTPARTAIDLAVGSPLPEALVLLDAAVRLACVGFLDQPRRRDYRSQPLVKAARCLLTEAASSVGCRRIEEAIGLADPARESAIESLSAGHFELAGLPRPRFQEPIRTPFGVFYPDCLWPEQRLIGEADGAFKYTDQAAIVAEKQREQILRDQGWGIVRWLGKEIMARPETVVERVARARDARLSSMSRP